MTLLSLSPSSSMLFWWLSLWLMVCPLVHTLVAVQATFKTLPQTAQVNVAAVEGDRWRRFLLASAAATGCCWYVTRPVRHLVRFVATASILSEGILHSLSVALMWSLYLLRGLPLCRDHSTSSPYSIWRGSLCSGILIVWPIHRSCLCARSTLNGSRPALWFTSISVAPCHHFMPKIIFSACMWNDCSCFT